MVAIVSGARLGLELSSLHTLGAAGVVGNAGEGRNGQSVYVNAATGNLVVQNRDELLVGRGEDALSLRTYNSRGTMDDDNGDNWSIGTSYLTVSGTVNTVGSTVSRRAFDGSLAVYAYDQPKGQYVTTEGAGAFDTIRFVAADNQFEWTDGDTQVSQRYEGSGARRLLFAQDPGGHRLTYAYGATGLLDTVTTSDGGVTKYLRNGALLTEVRTTSGVVQTSRVRYEYDPFSRLSKVTVDLTPENGADASVYVTTYAYENDTSRRITGITQSDGSRLVIAYNAQGQVESITNALGEETRFGYLPAVGAPTAMTVSHPAEGSTRFDVDGSGQLTRITLPASATAYRSFTYDTNTGDVLKVTDGESRTTTFEYQGGNQTRELDALGNSVTRAFNEKNQWVTQTVSMGTGSALVTRRVYDDTGVRLRFEISPEGRVTEHRYDNAFSFRSATIVHAGSAFDTVAKPSPVLSDLVTWVGSSPKTSWQRTDFIYDGRGMLAQRIAFATLDATGAGVRDAAAKVDAFVYDSAGQLLQVISPATGTTTNVYDGLGRLKFTQDAAGASSAYVYDDAANSTIVTAHNGLRTIDSYDRAGRLVSHVEASATADLSKTTYRYDSLGRLRMTTDPTGVRQWFLYDANGRKVADVDGNGTLTEYSYSNADLLLGKTTYAAPVDLTKLVDTSGSAILTASLEGASGVRPARTAEDIQIWNVYDGAGRLQRTARRIGTGTEVAVTEFHYDAASRLVKQREYAKTVTMAEGATALAAPAEDALQDRVSRTFYDKDGRVLATVDAAGALVEHEYDAAGQRVRQTAFAKLVTNVAAWQTADLSEFKTGRSSAGDITSYFHYDAKGQLVHEVDAERYVTERSYDAGGRETRMVRYATQLATVPATRETLDAMKASPKGEDQVTTRVYDARGRIFEERAPGDFTTYYTYDANGRVVLRTIAANNSDARGYHARYDLQGRLVAELSSSASAKLVPGADVEAIWSRYATKHAYDAAGRRISTTDPVGNTTYFYYNEDGALRYTQVGFEIRENEYDKLGRLKREIGYEKTVGFVGTGGYRSIPLPMEAVKDQVAITLQAYGYTRDGKLATSTDGTGSVTSWSYNAFGEATASVAQWSAGVSRAETYEVDARGLRTATTVPVGSTSITTRTEYDAFGRIKRSVDGRGNARTQEYDRLGRIVSTQAAIGAAVTTTYDAFGRKLTEKDKLGAVTSYTYNQAERSITVVTPEGMTTKSWLNRHGQVQTISDARGNVTEYLYTLDGQVSRVSTPLNFTTTTYDDAGRVFETQDANGVVVRYTYDVANRVLTRVVDPVGLALKTSYGYDAIGRQVSVKDANNVETLYVFDGEGRVLKKTVDPGAGKLALTTTYTHDAAGNVLTVETPGGQKTQYVYDALGRRTEEIVDPAGLKLRRTWTYDSAGNVATSTDALGNVTRYAYDTLNRLVFTVDPLGGVKRLSYDDEGRVTMSATLAARYTFTAAEASNVATISARVGGLTTQDEAEHRVYDRDGRMVATVNGVGAVVKYVYDAVGNVIARTAYANAVNNWIQGSTPNPSASTADQSTRTVYDALNRAVYTLDGLGGVTEYQYDKAGNVITRVAYAQLLSPTALTVPAMQQAIAKLAPGDRATTTYTYDNAGRLTWSVDAVGAVTRRVYDGNGNEVQHIAYANAVAPGTVVSAAPVAGEDRVTTRAYDAANRLVFEVDAMNFVSKRVYDGNGNMTGRTAYANMLSFLPTQGAVTPASLIAQFLSADAATDRTTTYAYDKAGRLTAQIDPMGSATSTTYDGVGRVTSVRRHAALAVGTAVPASNNALDQVDRFDYDAAGLLVRSWDAANNAQVYTYDGVGRRLTMTNRLGKVWTYTYDAAGRLLKETSPQVALTSTTAGSGSAVGSVTVVAEGSASVVTQFGYDALGNLTFRKEAAGRTEERTTYYEYDPLGRQVRVTLPAIGVYRPEIDTPTSNGAAGTVSPRLETDRTPQTCTLYDALGNAFANRDVGGVWSQKLYDRAGRLVYEIDALGYVTRYTRNAFGEVTALTRFAKKPGAQNLGVSLSSLESALAPLDHSEDRTVQTQYDRAGRAISTIQPRVYSYSGSGGVGFDAAATTMTRYNGFGDAVEVSAYRDASGTARATTTRYYDKAGREVSTVDAMGYLTRRSFDAFGNLLSLIEYAGALLPGSWNSVAALPPNPPSNAEDRTLEYGYDRLNRRVTETRKNVEYSVASGTTTRGDLVTWYTFDSVGNQTAVKDALGRTTYTTYDALGRVTAIARPTNSEWVDPKIYPFVATPTLTPLTTFKRDAHGNAVIQTEHANGTASVALNAAGVVTIVAGAADASRDRVTRTRFNAMGRATDTTDSGGHNAYVSYDVYGNVAKTWRGVSDKYSNGDYRTVFQVNVYDALGQLVETRTPASTMVLSGGIQASIGSPDAQLQRYATLSWSNLLDPAGGAVQVHIEHSRTYVPLREADGYQPATVTETLTETGTYTLAQATGGVQISWSLIIPNADPATVKDVVTYIRVTQWNGSEYVEKWSGDPAKAQGDGMTEKSQVDAGMVVEEQEFNAFGELVRKGVNGGGQEYFDYDNAGNVWRTNTGDGVDRIRLHDMQGNVTAEFQSSGTQNLRTYTAINAANDLTLRRVDTQYNALGHVTSRTEAARVEQTSPVAVVAERQSVSFTVTESAVYQNVEASSGASAWRGKNRVSLRWNSLAPLGSGDVRVSVQYATPQVQQGGFDSVPVYYTGGSLRQPGTSTILNGDSSATGVDLSWDELSSTSDGGIGTVRWVKVEKRDVYGFWRTVIDQAPGLGSDILAIKAPADTRAQVILETQVQGSGTWQAQAVTLFGDQYRFDARTLASGSYLYRVRVLPPGGQEVMAAEGALSVSMPNLAPITTAISYGMGSHHGVLYWAHQDPGMRQVFRYRPAGSTGAWSELHVEPIEWYDGVRTAQLAAGSYEWELLWSTTGQGIPTAHATGVISLNTAQQYFSHSVNTVAGTPAVSTREGVEIHQSPWHNGSTAAVRPVVYQVTDRWGNVTVKTDARSATWATTYRYNHNNQVVTQVQPNAGGGYPTTWIFYDAAGRQTSMTDALGRTNTSLYDGNDNVIQEIHADGGVVLNTYDAFGQRKATIDAEGRIVYFGYDLKGNLISQTKGGGSGVVVYELGLDQNIASKGQKNLYDIWEYDELGQRISSRTGTADTQEIVKYRYDLRGNLIRTTQPLGQTTEAAFDAAGRKIAEVDANRYSARWTYDYFGQLRDHTDLGGARYTYTYDAARQLVIQKNGREQHLEYTYDGAGQVTRILDVPNAKVSEYAYDASGRRIVERTTQQGNRYQDNHLAYDELGRLRVVADARAYVWMDYDLVGNRTYVGSNVGYQGTNGAMEASIGRYFKYDAMNRQTLVDGVDAAGNINTSQGHVITYDKNGNRTSDTFYGTRIATASGEAIIETYETDGAARYKAGAAALAYTRSAMALTTEKYRYDSMNRLQSVERDGVQIDLRRYDGADRTVQTGTVGMPENYRKLLAESDGGNVRFQRYDLNGRLMHQDTYNYNGVMQQQVTWDGREAVGSFIPDGYDPVGNALGYVVKTGAGVVVAEYTTEIARFEQHQALHTIVNKAGGGVNRLTQVYDKNGYLVGVTDVSAPQNNRTFVNDASGRALFVNQSGNVQRQLIANGEVLGLYGVGATTSGNTNPNFANIIDFDFGYAPVTGSYPSPTPGAYTVRMGDTLQSIAQSAYGDSALWYRIAEANGLAKSTDLKVGQTLNIPNRVGTVHNDSTTFKPYDPSKITGDLTPAMPEPGNKGCGGAGQLLMVIVAVVATIFTAGALAGAVGSLSSIMSTGMSVLTTGAGALGATSIGATIGFAGTMAISAGVGSIASQAVGLATGTIEKFDWKGVALAAVGGAVSAAIPADAFAGAGRIGGAVARGAVSNTLTQGIAVASGVQRSFSWRAVAASAVGAGVAQVVAPVFGAALGGDFAARLATGLVSGVVAGAMRGGKSVMRQVAIDAFGNALGYSLAGASNGAPAAQAADHLGDFIQGGGERPPGVLVADAGDVLRLSKPTSTEDDAYYANIINALQARDAARQSASGSFRAGESRATAALYASGAGDVRETTPVPQSTLTAPSMLAISDGYFDDTGQAWPAPISSHAIAHRTRWRSELPGSQ